MKNKWYRNSLVIAASLILFFPVGILWMWLFASWNKVAKVAITAIFLILIVIGAKSGGSQPSTSPTGASSPQPTTEVVAKPTETPKSIEKVKVEVTSEIVKKVGKKYRYFFDIRNNDTKNFEGSVTISLYNNENKSPLGKNTFVTEHPIKPSLGDTVYIDANTGPVGVYGDLGITKFKYVVKINDNEVNSGEGIISEKFENLGY